MTVKMKQQTWDQTHNGQTMVNITVAIAKQQNPQKTPKPNTNQHPTKKKQKTKQQKAKHKKHVFN